MFNLSESHEINNNVYNMKKSASSCAGTKQQNRMTTPSSRSGSGFGGGVAANVVAAVNLLNNPVLSPGKCSICETGLYKETAT